MRNLKMILLSVVMAFASSQGYAKKSITKSPYFHAVVGPFSSLTKTIVSLPAGIVGGVEGTVKSKAKKVRVLHGLGYGVLGTVCGAVGTVLSPITMPLNIYRAATKQEVKCKGENYILNSYYRSLESDSQSPQAG